MRLGYIALLTLFSFVPVCRAETAEEMLSMCTKLSQAKISDGTLTIPPDFDSGRCFGSFQAILWYESIRTTASREAILHVCMTEGATATQLLAIFTDYVKRNPKLLNQKFFAVAHNAILEAFPCSPQKH